MNHTLEIEIKAKLDQPLAEKNIAALGFHPGPCLLETDVYFNGPHRDFRKTDEALRLRFAEDLGSGQKNGYITYKGPKLDTRSQTRREIQAGIDDLDQMTELLRALGYQDVYTVQKRRQEYQREAITLCLDEVGGLGSFIELELVAPDEGLAKKEAAIDQLLALLDALSVPRTNLTDKSYLELMISCVTS